MPVAPLPLSETIAPATRAEVADALRRAHDERAAVYPLGGGTHVGLGAWPDRPGWGLSLAGLHRVVDHAVGDLTVTVEAGLTVAALQKTLAQRRQRLPIDVASPERATLGGAVAIDAAGPRRHGYGSIRDYVLGLEAVDGRGVPFSAGGRVVKNAAGYNVARLLAGSLGTLAVVTQVTLLVRPLPEATALVSLGVPSFEAAERILAGLVHTAARPVAVQWLLGPAWADDPALARAMGATGAAGEAGELLLGLEGSGSEVAWMVDSLRTELERAGARGLASIDGAAVEPILGRLAGFSTSTATPALVVQLAVAPSAVVRTAQNLLEFDPGASLCIAAGVGLIQACFAVSAGEMATLLAERLRPLAAAAGGVLTVLAHPPEARLGAATVWGSTDGAATVLMPTLKERFDPHDVLNPGRLITGVRKRA